MIQVPQISATPAPLPLSPPGVAPPPQMPAAGSPGGAPQGVDAGTGQAPPGADPAAAPAPPTGALPAAPGPDVTDPPQPQEVRPRLIPGTDAQEGDVPASAAEQADLQQLLVKAGMMIHSRQSRDQVLTSLHDPQATVAQAVGRTAAGILMAASSQKQATGSGPIGTDVLKEAAAHVIPELMDVGIAAGIFPLKPAEGGGVGTDAYNKELRMAMLEATKAYGEAQLRRPDAPELTEQAQNEWASNVSREVEAGQASPEYMAAAKQQQKPGGLIPTQPGAPAPAAAAPAGKGVIPSGP